jgi:cytochrome b-561
MPDWFLMWGYGFLKLVPSWMSFELFGIHVSSEFIGGLVLPGLVFVGVALWPFIDYEEDPTHFAVSPLKRPWQTAVGVAAVVFIMVASIAGMDVIVADIVGMPTDALKPYFIGLLVLWPLLSGGVTYAALGGFGDSDESPAAGDGETSATSRDPSEKDGQSSADGNNDPEGESP